MPRRTGPRSERTGSRSRWCAAARVFVADRPRLDAQTVLDRPRRKLDAGRIGALVRLDQTLIVLARELAVDRQPDRPVAAAARKADRVVDARLVPGIVSTFFAYCAGANTCSRSAPSCTSPKVPRVLTLLSTRLSEPTSLASFCISPMPRCTCSSRSATWRKLSPSRCSRVACSFSSTVARICSSFFSLSAWIASSRVSTAALTSVIRWSLARTSACSCSASVSESSFSELAWRAPWAFCVSARCCCIAASWRLKLSICSFWVRAVSPCCASSVCWNSASDCESSCRVPCALRMTSSRISRACRSMPASAGGRRRAIQTVRTTRTARSATTSQSKGIRNCRSGERRCRPADLVLQRGRLPRARRSAKSNAT